jgi:hypothetical protein
MSDDTPTPAEPSNADLLAFMRQAFTALTAKVDELNERVEHVEGMLDQVGEDVVAVKVNQGFTDRHIADFQTWARRHQGNPNAHGTAA